MKVETLSNNVFDEFWWMQTQNELQDVLESFFLHKQGQKGRYCSNYQQYPILLW